MTARASTDNWQAAETRADVWKLRAEAAEAKLAEAVKVLRTVEWSARGTYDDWICPNCYAYEYSTHDPDCKLATLIGGRK